MKFLAILFSVFLICITGYVSQAQQTEVKKYSPAQLRQDLGYLRYLITHVHVNPNSELTPREYDKLFSSVDSSLNDTINASDFLKKIKPIIAYLSDEHSQINLKSALLSRTYRAEAVYLPFTLKNVNGNYIVDDCLDNRWSNIKGQSITTINGAPLKAIIQKCALATTGIPGQRMAAALLQFGYLYPWASPVLTTSFILQTKDGKSLKIEGTTLQVWDDYLAAKANNAACEERLSYKRYGDAGYIYACSFDAKPKGKYSLDSIKRKIDDIFRKIEQDGVKRLVIDVSHNEGGNSGVGDYLISYIYRNPYMDYQTYWKRSDEYLQLLNSWGIKNAAYAAEPVGKVLHYPSERVNPVQVAHPFQGKVVIAIGPATFSSALTFATLIRDNHIAKLIGQTPVNGHPNEFGEMYYTNLPNTQIFVRFGVKEYIRPAGNIADKNLKPDITLTDTQIGNIDELIRQIK